MYYNLDHPGSAFLRHKQLRTHLDWPQVSGEETKDEWPNQPAARPDRQLASGRRAASHPATTYIARRQPPILPGSRLAAGWLRGWLAARLPAYVAGWQYGWLALQLTSYVASSFVAG